MSSKSSVPEPAWVDGPMVWGPSSPMPLYLSYGMVSLKGRRPALTDAVAAAESFTALSPPLGLDYFAVFDGGRLGAPAAERIDGELRSETPRFDVASASHSDDVVGWWSTIIQEAFQAVNGEAVAGAVVALVLEKYIVVASCGCSKAVLSCGGENIELVPDHRANRADDSTSKAHKALQATRASGSSVVHGPPVATLDVAAVERTAWDDFLVLSSDGLWDVVAPAEVCAFVRQRKLQRIAMPWEPQLDARGLSTVLAKELAEQAVRAGSQDNVSVVLVVFKDFWVRKPSTLPLEATLRGVSSAPETRGSSHANNAGPTIATVTAKDKDGDVCKIFDLSSLLTLMFWDQVKTHQWKLMLLHRGSQGVRRGPQVGLCGMISSCAFVCRFNSPKLHRKYYIY